ncbi:MAG: hemerythrin family protein [Alphaproteobacteria bacterium]|jgi:hemerythrin|nr:hemerythrin family protein [Alphaproteobacteria bacterium]
MTNAELLVWSDSFVTGVAEIDEQHRILVNTLNEANSKLTDTSSIELLEQITRDLLSYALYHFETEEDLMQNYDYVGEKSDESGTHLEQHRAFSAKVVAVRDGLKSGSRISRDDLLSFLNGWLVNHILNTDKKLGAFISAKRGAA